jgi:hypothetical protein
MNFIKSMFTVLLSNIFEKTFCLFDVWVLMAVVSAFTIVNWQFWVCIVIGCILSGLGHVFFCNKDK